MAEPRNISRQEQILVEAQRKLDRIEKMREEMARQVELEMQRLEEMREVQEDFTQSPGTQPSLSNAAPSSFQSQFDQFSSTKSNERLKTANENRGGLLKYITTAPEKLRPPGNDESFYQTNDRDEHWQSLTENPGKPVYVSGRYISSEHGNNTIDSMKEYEYELSVRAIPVSVGDVLRASVHPTGHGDGKAYTTGHLQFQVTDIYSSPKFHKYHDRIEG